MQARLGSRKDLEQKPDEVRHAQSETSFDLRLCTETKFDKIIKYRETTTPIEVLATSKRSNNDTGKSLTGSALSSADHLGILFRR